MLSRPVHCALESDLAQLKASVARYSMDNARIVGESVCLKNPVQ